MDYKIDVDRLAVDELLYELEIRGVTGISKVDDMRRNLRSVLKLEKLGKAAYPTQTSFEAETEVKTCREKLEDIKKKLPPTKAGEVKKLDATLTHVLTRLRRIHSTEEIIKSAISELNQACIEYYTAIGVLEKDPEHQTDTDNEVEGDSKDQERRMGDDSGPRLDDPLKVTTVIRKTQIPPKEWGIHFSGEESGLSINAFLERIEEIREARNVTMQDLYQSAFDLFKGTALVWYRAMRREVNSWQELVSELRKEFEPQEYQDRLWEEIKRRTQGPTETVGIFVAIMKNYFNRIPERPTEEQMLKVLMKNLHPYYLDRLALTNIENIKDLIEVGRKLENAKWKINVHQPPPNSRGLLEPDLAYDPPNRRSDDRDSSKVCSMSTSTQPVRRFACWNCSSTGHAFRQCKAPRTLFCEGCGLKDTRRNACPRCSKRSGNGEGAQA